MFAELLLTWYDRNRRSFPWREKIFITREEHAYHTWVCEVMSQQTLLSVLLPKYTQFLTELPDLEALYQCSEEKLRFLWKGLGYYARARNLQKGAGYIIHQCDRILPTTHADWKKVPGCGDYTSAIIASICYQEAIAAVDGNAIRVASRLLNFQENSVWTQTGYKKIFNFLNHHISHKRPGDFNQAIMDLGATLCKKSDPTCFECPIKNYCLAYQKNTMNLCPPIKPRAEKINKNLYIFIMRQMNDKKHIGILQRTNGFLKHTTGFPICAEENILEVKKYLEAQKSTDVNIRFLNKTFKHSITKHDITGNIVCIDFCFKVNNYLNTEHDVKANVQNLLQNIYINTPVQWFDQSELKDLLSSSLDQKAYKTFLSAD